MMTTLPEPAWPPAEEKPWMSRKKYQVFNRQRAVRCWLWPYLRSRLHPYEFRPLLAYLFTEWKCNLDCHYCWAHSNKTSGMTEEVALSAIDWLHDAGCRALAIMGGEPLLRPKLIHKIVAYATVIIRTDGTLAPCFTYYSADTDWGRIGNPRLDIAQLDQLKKTCTANCLSTCQHTLGYAYNAGHAARWLARQAGRGFRGVTGSF